MRKLNHKLNRPYFSQLFYLSIFLLYIKNIQSREKYKKQKDYLIYKRKQYAYERQTKY
jgi:hypothetical protein